MHKVELLFPVVKLSVEDIANLRSVNSEAVKCGVSDKGMARLKALGLVESKKLPACPKETAEYETKLKDAEQLLRTSITRNSIDWKNVNAATSKRPAEWQKPKERHRDVITKAGLALLEKGSVQVEIHQSC